MKGRGENIGYNAQVLTMSSSDKNMKELLKEYFESRKIEYYAVLPYDVCKETSPNIMSRESFVPKSVIIYLLPYYTGECVNISRYSASLDYHIALRETADGLIKTIKETAPDSSAKGYGDHSPINEVNAALISGLGIIGDNGLLINEKYGSYIFIGDIVTDIEPDILGAAKPVKPDGCKHCGACKRACPTGILRGEGKDCLSAITQRKGELSIEEAELMRKYNTVWGCDICQSSCPYNKDPRKTAIEFFYRDRISELTLDLLDGMSKAEFEKRAFAWRGRKTVERNLNICI